MPTSRSPLALLLTLWLFFPSVWAARETAIYPSDNPELYRSISLIVSLGGVSVLAFCLARRSIGFTRDVPWSRWLLIAIFLDSWIFIFASAIMISGIGLSLSEQTCLAGIFLCIVFYALSKVLIYMFLAERVHAVHAGKSRLQSTAYRICLFFLLGYAVVLALMIWGRIGFLRDGTTHRFMYTERIMEGNDNACVIGLITPASLSLLIYDLILNVLFTSLFLYPLYQSSNRLSPRLRRLARRTLVAAAVALVTSAVNIAVLTKMHGQQLGWICLGSCGADATINALALFFVTTKVDDPDGQTPVVEPTRTPHSKRLSGTTAHQRSTRKSKGLPEPSVAHIRSTSSKVPGPIFVPDIAIGSTKEIPVSQPRVRFPSPGKEERSFASEYEMTNNLGFVTPSPTTATFLFGNPTVSSKSDIRQSIEEPDDRSKYLQPDSYRGKVTRAGVNASIEMVVPGSPTSGSPMPEETHVQVRMEGPPSRSASRPMSWMETGRGASPPQTERRASLDADVEAQTRRIDTPQRGNLATRVLAMFRSNSRNRSDEPRSMIISVQTMTEQHRDPSSRYSTDD